MFELKQKAILIISPQPWGTMHISKHHYAKALAEVGNSIYFLNPPSQHNSLKSFSFSSKRFSEIDNLFIVNHRMWFPYIFKFKFKFLYNVLVKYHINKLVRKLEVDFDIIWSFDIGNVCPLSLFPKYIFKIFHPVDEPSGKESFSAAKSANVLFTVTPEILSKYEGYHLPKFVINHGLADIFFQDYNHLKKYQKPSIGLSGNLLRKDIDWKILFSIIKDHADATFHFWGAYNIEESNIGGGDNRNNLNQLKAFKNVILHGALPPHKLASEVNKVDMFLICYDVNLDQSKGTNYHKILEYLSTGRVIVANNISNYNELPDLVSMVEERNNNLKLPELFREVINNLDVHNDQSRTDTRVSFARSNSYKSQINRIEKNLQAVG